MNRRTFYLWTALLVGAAAAPANAEQYDANCQRVSYSEDQLFEQEVCKSHAGCAMIMAGADKFCSGVDFLRNIGNRITGTKPLTNEDVIEATEPDYPKSTFTSRVISKVKSVTDAVFDSRPEASMQRVSDGTIGYYETLPSGADRRAGAIVYSDGVKVRGQINSSLSLNGTGEFISADGKVRAGDFQKGQLSGEGFKTSPSAQGTEVYEGTFDGDVPVGEVLHRFADGMSARELWQNGKMIERGALASRGKVPPPLIAQLAATPSPPPRRAYAAAPATTYSQPASSALAGTWRGENTGNMVRLETRSGGYYVSAVSTNSGQGTPLFYAANSDGTYRYTFPDGQQSVVRVLGPNQVRVTNPDGWTDIFDRM